MKAYGGCFWLSRVALGWTIFWLALECREVVRMDENYLVTVVKVERDGEMMDDGPEGRGLAPAWNPLVAITPDANTYDMCQPHRAPGSYSIFHHFITFCLAALVTTEWDLPSRI